MASFNFKLELSQSDATIQKLILKALKDEVFNLFKKSAKTIKRDIRFLVMRRLRSQPEYKALQAGGKLQIEFGISNPIKVENIITRFANSVTVFVLFPRVYAQGLKGGIEIRAVPADYSDVLADENAYQQTEHGVTLEWLNWLLTEGNRKIIRNYTVKYTDKQKSRTGKAVMITSKKYWGVPPEYSGTTTNNWVTRAFEGIEDEINQIVKRNVENVM